MMSQHQDSCTSLNFTIEQMIREGRKISTPQQTRNEVEAAWISLNLEREFFKLLVKTAV